MTAYNHDDLIANNLSQIKTTKVVYPQIYSYVLPDITVNSGSQKIGYTERKDVDVRIREQTHTAAIQLRSEKLWSAPAFFNGDLSKDFKDKSFHKFLIKNGIENRTDLGKEWFFFNGTPEKSKQLFDTFREQGFAALQTDDKKIPYTLRSEQVNAVEQAKEYFETHENGEFLWNAKPRFGKTLATYDLAKRLEAQKVLIVTNRPAIANSWFDDFEAFIDGYSFISDTSSLADRTSLTREQYTQMGVEIGTDKPQITFLSLQDLKGSKYFGGSHDKLRWVADLDWDLLVIDEAHEGIDTGRTDAAFTTVNRKYTLHLSGTPFKALANNKFSKEAIFNWTYLDEQKIKKAELEEEEIGDHTDLPDLRLYTYRISQMVADEVNDGVEIDDEARDYAFDLNEFFATKNQKFVHESDVKEFLKNLTSNAKYPFSTPELRDELRHTFWYVGNRVDSVKALEQLLREDPVFKDYKIVVAAGDGKTFDEEENDFKGNERSFDKVKAAIAENPKTITLSCGQLTTGVTVKEWSAVLMLTDIKTPAQYMQAAFRAQNPYRFEEDGVLKAKRSAYLFDFAPTRVLEIYDQFANALNPKAANGEITESERKDNIKELLNFFPVISEDIDGQMVELDAEKVLTFPNALAATEIVKARFMTNLLFNENIKGVFSFPKEVEDILDKMPVEKNKRVEIAKKELDLDDARKVEQDKTVKINENSNVILGQKIYRANIDRVVDNVLNYDTPDEVVETLSQQVMELAEPVIAKYKDIYKATNAELEEKKKQIEEKVKLVVVEFENSDIKDVAALKERLAKVIEHDFVETAVEEKETESIEKVQKSKEDEVRDRLRSFTRTIPMFIMANSSEEEITIDTFDLGISDEDFVDLTNITKEEFHKLRDGFDYEDSGERMTFGGVFDRYKFNASIAEFVAEKQKRADYFKSEEDIFELIPNQKNNQIFTPKAIVKKMIDDLEAEQPELFQRTDSTFIDLYMKSGLYITEIVKKLFINTRHNYNSDEECIKNILEKQVYGFAPTGVLQGITQSFIFGFDAGRTISNRNFIHHDLLPEAEDDNAPEKIAQLFGNGGSMIKFDAVVGNPPYQESVEKSEMQSQANSKWVYYQFQNLADKVGNRSSLIYPFGGWFDDTGSFQGFGKKILSDGHTVRIKAFEGTSDRRAWYRTDIGPKPVFGENANISAGVSIVNRDQLNTHEVFEYSNRIYSDVIKTVNVDEWSRLSPDPSFTVGNKLFGDKLEKHVINKTFGIESDFVEKNPNLVSLQPDQFKEPIRLLTNDRAGSAGRAKWFYIDKSTIEKNVRLIDEYKIAMASAYPKKTLVSGVPTIDNVHSRASELIQLYEPNTIFGRSKMLIFSSPEKVEAENFMKYTQTRFFAYMVLNEPNRSFSFGFVIPVLDVTLNSDIDWSKSISEIDQQIYEKYGLTQEEIDLIESRVKEAI